MFVYFCTRGWDELDSRSQTNTHDQVAGNRFAISIWIGVARALQSLTRSHSRLAGSVLLQNCHPTAPHLIWSPLPRVHRRSKQLCLRRQTTERLRKQRAVARTKRRSVCVWAAG